MCQYIKLLRTSDKGRFSCYFSGLWLMALTIKIFVKKCLQRKLCKCCENGMGTLKIAAPKLQTLKAKVLRLARIEHRFGRREFYVS